MKLSEIVEGVEEGDPNPRKIRVFKDEENLEAVHAALDRHLPLHDDGTAEGKATQNQCDKIVSKGNSATTLWYVSLNQPYGDIEAYVLVTPDGCSYVDYTKHVLVRDDKVIDKLRTDEMSLVDDWVDKYTIESGRGAPESIRAYRDLLDSFE